MSLPLSFLVLSGVVPTLESAGLARYGPGRTGGWAQTYSRADLAGIRLRTGHSGTAKPYRPQEPRVPRSDSRSRRKVMQGVVSWVRSACVGFGRACVVAVVSMLVPAVWAA